MKTKIFYLCFVFLIVLTGSYCKKPATISFLDIYSKYQWRKTTEAIYNADNEFEKYTYNFETAEDCEKNSYIYLNYIYNMCKNNCIGYYVDIQNDSIYYIPHNSDTIHIKICRYIEYYDNRNFIFRYDTLINGENKIIKETYSAFDL